MLEKPVDTAAGAAGVTGPTEVIYGTDPTHTDAVTITPTKQSKQGELSGSVSKGIHSGNVTESKDKDDSTLQEENDFKINDNSDTGSDDFGRNDDDNDLTVVDITEYKVPTNLDNEEGTDKKGLKISLIDGPQLSIQISLGDARGAINRTATNAKERKSEDCTE